MSEQQWPEDARRAVRDALPSMIDSSENEYQEVVEAVLAALAPHVVVRPDPWTWGFLLDGDYSYVWIRGDEESARRGAAIAAGRVVVRRRAGLPPGPWEADQPLADLLGPHRGPCGLCGGPDARHRVLDAIHDRMSAEEDPAAIADDYDGYGLAAADVERIAREHRPDDDEEATRD